MSDQKDTPVFPDARAIREAAYDKYPKAYSGYTNEQVEMNANRSRRISAFEDGVKWLMDYLTKTDR
jgi:hypothetical protein